MTRQIQDLDERTPVLVGVGQFAEQVDGPGYRGLSPVGLAAEAARAALADTGVDPAEIASLVDVVAATRQFENSMPGFSAPFGRSLNFPRSVARDVGADPARAVLEVAGGQSPQHLVNELAAAIADGSAEWVLVVGAEATSTVRHLQAADETVDWSEDPGGQLEDRGFALAGLISRQGMLHGLSDAPSQYALFDNARCAALGLGRDAYARSMGELFAPFSAVAAVHQLAVSHEVHGAEELATVTERNRMIAAPYPKLMVSRDLVNQSAAVLITSLGEARRRGVPEEKLVFLAGHADLRERDLFDRSDLAVAPSAAESVRVALEIAEVALEDVGWFDLYSCFPVAVSNVLDGLGLEPDDARGFTLTGGLPFFGGPGNNYSLHAIAEAVGRGRLERSSYGVVGANGGTLSKYSVGVYTAVPTPWRADRNAPAQARLDFVPAVEITDTPNGWARIETWTVKHGRRGRTAVVIGRLEADGRRFVANGVDGDEDLLALLEGELSPVGARVFVRATGLANRIALSEDELERLLPTRVPGFRDDYEFVSIRRDGRVLEVTLDRPDSRNALHPPAHEELQEIFDAYFADPGLWVAIITGAGEKSFCAGNDLLYGVTGKPVYMPPGGFAGLTSRAAMTKPVIAAVNGVAMGGGFEIALACHLVVADEQATFALSEVKVGVFAGAGGLVRLPRRVPVNVANEMILTGRRIGAAEAKELGIVNRVAAPGAVMDLAREVAAEIVAVSPTSVRLSLQVMEETRSIADEAEATTRPTKAIDHLLVSEDMLEGTMAFIERRPPVWLNR